MSQEIDRITPPADAEVMPTGNVSDDAIDLLMRQAQAMETAHKLAVALCSTDMVPQTYKGKPENGAAAILYGAELGLKPLQSLQQIFVVHGTPAIYARTMSGLLKARGYRFDTIESTDESVTVTGTSPKGEQETSTWTIDRAKRAGYTSNKKYQSDPQAMLYAKALSEVSRKLAPDVLLGITYTAEDLQLEESRAQVKVTRLDKPRQQRGAAGVKAALESKQAPQIDVDSIIAAFNTASSIDELNAVTEQARGIPADHPQREAAEHAYTDRYNAIMEAEALASEAEGGMP